MFNELEIGVLMNKRRILALMIVLLMASATGCGKSDINIESDEESSGSEASVEVVSGVSADSAEEDSASVLDSSEDYWSKLYSEAKECPNAANFEGEWYGGEHSSYSGEITITDQSEKGFHFSGFFYYYLHTGEIEGDALFVKDNVAVYKYTEAEDEYLSFEMDGDTMHVKQEGLLGLGMNVWAGRDYTREKKAFINDDILNKSSKLKQTVLSYSLLFESKVSEINNTKKTDKKAELFQDLSDIVNKMKTETEKFNTDASDAMNRFIPTAIQTKNQFYAQVSKYLKNGIPQDFNLENKEYENAFIDAMIETLAYKGAQLY